MHPPTQHPTLPSLLLLSSLAVACSNASSLTSKLPPCERACVAPVRGAPIVQLPTDAASEANVWTITNESGPKVVGTSKDSSELLQIVDAQNRAQISLGWPMPSTLYIACAHDASGARVADLIKTPEAKSFGALGLGGTNPRGDAGFAVLRVWDPPTETRDTKTGNVTRLTRKGALFTHASKNGAKTFKAPEEIPRCTPTEACPILLFNLTQWTCGELITWVDTLAAKNRLVGLTTESIKTQ